MFSRPTATAACRWERSEKGGSWQMSSYSTPPKEKTLRQMEDGGFATAKETKIEAFPVGDNV